jgi:chromate transport protein ChrA
MSTPTTQVIIPQDVEKSPEFATSNQVLPTHQSLEAEYDDNSRVPQLSILQIFWLFFSQFGIFAWGGPVAQIALIKERLVVKDQWITMARFIRVFGVYQILPGPEAAELCMFFGCLAGGRWGGLAAGLGFVLPGFVLMLAASYIYVVVGFGNTYFDASFRALQPMVAAMVSTFSQSLGPMFKTCYGQILRATHKIAEHALVSHETKKPSVWLVLFALFTVLNSALRINWY